MNDPEIRAILRAHLRIALPVALVTDELGILRGRVFADVVAVDDMLHGFEIKAARDSLSRLPGQVDAYSRVFDRCTLVTEPSHLRAVLGILPAWWGVTVMVDGVPREERPAAPNEGVEPLAVATLLWMEDVTDMLAERRALRGYRGKPMHELWARMCEVFTGDEIRAAARGVVRARRGPPMAEEIAPC